VSGRKPARGTPVWRALSIFPTGVLVITPTAEAAIPQEDWFDALCRHVTGDWGDVCAEDKAENDGSLAWGERILSVYKSSKNIPFWIITEADRSATTILLPGDY